MMKLLSGSSQNSMPSTYSPEVHQGGRGAPSVSMLLLKGEG